MTATTVGSGQAVSGVRRPHRGHLINSDDVGGDPNRQDGGTGRSPRRIGGRPDPRMAPLPRHDGEAVEAGTVMNVDGNATKVDAVARRLADGLGRRAAVGRMVAGGAAALVAAGVMGSTDGEAGKKNKRCLRAGKPCSGNKQCCPKETDRICDVPTGGSSSDTYCCGGKGGRCGGANIDGDAVGLKCCARFRCSTGDPDAEGFQPNTPGKCLADPE